MVDRVTEWYGHTFKCKWNLRCNVCVLDNNLHFWPYHNLGAWRACGAFYVPFKTNEDYRTVAHIGKCTHGYIAMLKFEELKDWGYYD